MIRIEHLNKHYNKNKKNALHVLNDMSLDFGTQGLVVLLGASGSGKTTLLNVLGGMDRFHEGVIHYGTQAVHKYRSSVYDQLRNEKFGMIFQNYYLLPYQTVYDNIAVTLNMIGVADSAVIETRVEAVLKAVNMANYGRRKANQLSGGQQQRVAIARALAKNPDIILADEPTGNLDSRNTLEIMRIIKAISRTKLVIMVTHERKLANYFADRIIEIEDGKIIEDRENASNGTLDYAQETDIYLQDLNHHSIHAATAPLKVDLYTDEHDTKPLSARLIVKNKTLYLDLGGYDVKKVVVVNENTEVKLIDAARETHEVTEGETVDLDMDAPFALEDSAKKRRRAIINPKAIVQQTIEKLLEAGRGQKLLYLGFAIGAMVVAYAVSNVFNILTIDDAVFLEMSKETIVVKDQDFANYDAFINDTQHTSIAAFSLTQNVALNFSLPRVFTQYSYLDSVELSGFLAPLEGLTERQLVHGRLPTTPLEIVVSESWINRIVKESWELMGIDYQQPEAIMQMKIPILINADTAVLVQIVGISDNDAPVIHMHAALNAYFTGDGYLPRALFAEQVNIIEGRDIENPLEIIVGTHHPRNVGQSLTVSGQRLEVVGKYTILDDDQEHETNKVMLATEDLNRLIYARSTQANRERFLFSSNPKATLDHFESLGIHAVHAYPIVRGEYQMNRLESALPNLIFSAVTIVASGLAFYFIIRSSMISRMYEIGVYRSLGTKKRDLVKRFAIESAVITTFSSLIGFLIMSYIIASALRAVEQLEIGHVSLLSVVSGIVLIYLINVTSGVIPVTMLLRRTPAEINTKYDL